MTRTVDTLTQIASFADALPAGVWVGSAATGQCVYINREFEKILGILPPEDAARGNYVGPYGVHRPSGEPYPEKEMPFERVLTSKKSEVVDDVVIHRHDGSKCYLRVFASPLWGDDGEVAYVVEAFTDITREIEARHQLVDGERQLQAMRRLESVGSLAGGVAHDFNNLLAIVKLASALLKEQEQDPARLELIGSLDDVADSAAKLTSALLGFARRGKHLSQPVSVHEVIGSVLELARRTFERRMTVSSTLHAAPDVVLGDSTQIEQLVMNLMMNAREAIKGSGTITVRAHREAVRGMAALKDGDYVVIEVEDTGAGIDPAVRERIFEPYVSTKDAGAMKGTGLGLANVYGVAIAHGGLAEVATSSASGTVMRAYLPASGGVPQARPTPTSSKAVRGQGRILVVDDEPLVLRMTERALTSLGYQVVTAINGAAALTAWQQAAEPFDVVVLDMVMAGLDGRETYLALKTLDPTVRVLLMTGYALNNEAQHILELGVRGFLAKPFNVDELSVALNDVLAV